MRLVVDANAMNNTYTNVCYIERIERPNENSIHQHNQINTNFNLKHFLKVPSKRIAKKITKENQVLTHVFKKNE